MMEPIDWDKIVEAIRHNRFHEITPEQWVQVADKIETLIPTKRGRPANDNLHTVKKCVNGLWVSAWGEGDQSKDFNVLNRYRKLRSENMKAGVAKKKVADELGVSVKSLEALVARHNRLQKALFGKNDLI